MKDDNKDMKKALSFLVSLSSIALVACSSISPLKSFKQLTNPEKLEHPYSSVQWNDPEYKEFVKKMKSFSLKLSEAYSINEFNDNNIAISPASIELCLGLSIRCANSETREQLLKAMDVDYESFNKYYKYFYNSILSSPDSYNKGQITLSNSMWFDNDVPLKKDGLNGLENDYYCYSYEVDFNGKNSKTNQAMADFVKKQTKNLLHPNFSFDPLTFFVLMNTLYVKDTWGYDISEIEYTDQYKFTNADGTVSNKKLLDGLYTTCKAIQQDSFSAFYEPLYRTCLYFIKPEPGHTIKEVFTKENIEYITNNSNYTYQDDTLLERYHTHCVFPEFTVNTDIDLIELLSNSFNIKSLFDDACDFSNITDAFVYCSEIKHMLKLIVNNKGIEGAALTYAALSGAAGPDEYKDVYETFLVDKEFGFILTRNNAILFSGIISNID